MFVYGLTGSGKTALLRNILLSNLGRENLNISAIDFSGQLVEGVADRLQNSIAWSRDSALDFLQGLADMCKSREEPLRSCEYVFIDEIDMLSKPYQQQDFIDALDTIQTQGRAIGVHLFVGAQRLDWLSESFLAGFGHRIVMGSVSSKMGLRSLGQLLDCVSDLSQSPADRLTLIGGGIHHQEGTIVRVAEGDSPFAIRAVRQDPGVRSSQVPTGGLFAGDGDAGSGKIGEGFGGCVAAHGFLLDE